MALSDTCSDVLSTLTNDLVHYSSLGYNPKELSKIVTAMYEISSFMVRQDLPPSIVEENIDTFLDNCVINNLLQVADKNGEIDFPEILAKIAQHNSRLKQGINSMLGVLSNKNNTFHLIKDSRLFDQLSSMNRDLES